MTLKVTAPRRRHRLLLFASCVSRALLFLFAAKSLFFIKHALTLFFSVVLTRDVAKLTMSTRLVRFLVFILGTHLSSGAPGECERIRMNVEGRTKRRRKAQRS